MPLVHVSRPAFPRWGAGRWIWTLAAAVGGAWLILVAVVRFDRALVAGVPWDLVVDQRLARGFADGFNPYSDEGQRRTGLEAMGPVGSGHPPTSALWALRFAHADVRAAARLVGFICCLALLTSLLLVFRALGAPAVLAWLLFGVVLASPFMTYHVGVGQLSALIAAFYAVAWWAARRGKDLVAGLALGLACTIKLFPGVMLVLFLVQRRFRIVLAALAVYAAAVVATVVRFGWSAWPTFFARQRAVADLWMDGIQNQSLHGVVLRLFHPACQPHASPFLAATLISMALGVGVLVVGALGARRAEGGDAFDLAYAFFAVASVLLSQWAWEHYDVIYVLPAVLTAATLLKLRQRWATLVGGGVLVALAASWQLEPARKLALQTAVRAGDRSLHLAMHAHELANWIPPVALLAFLGALLWRTRPRAESAAVSPSETGGSPANSPRCPDG